MLHFERKKKKPSPEGLNLLGSILICYTEVATVSYEPGTATMKFSFALKHPLTKDGFRKQANFLGESLDAYHLLEGYGAMQIDFSMESHGDTAFLYVTRDIATLSRGEMDLLVSLMRECFGDDLLVDDRISERMDPDFAANQGEVLDRTLINIRELSLSERLVGLREEDRVVVYNR